MGAMCGSAPRDEPSFKASKAIDQELRRYQDEFHKQVKMLLLGPGESGKSTVFKQMKIIQDNGGFTEDELLGFKHVIHSNCISQMRALVQAAAHLQMQFRSEQAFRCAQTLLQLPQHGATWSKEIGTVIETLWSDQGIRETYSFRGTKFQLNDTADYFFDNIKRFEDDSFTPTEDDVLRCRVRSTGIEEALFLFDRQYFTLVDVGGQRSERRKWIHCFDCVTAVLFCASLASYDMVLREDNSQNRMAEAILLFDEVVNSSIFKERAIILFLNKTDLFAQKIQHVALNVLFPEYTGGADFESGCTFIKERFEERSRSGAKSYVHFTCALDTKNIKHVIDDVRIKILRSTFSEMGL